MENKTSIRRVGEMFVTANHYQHGVNNTSFVFYTFEHRYEYGKGQISIDPCRYEHHVSVCLYQSPNSAEPP